MVEQELIRAMLESDVQPLFGIFGITAAGLGIAAPYVLGGLQSLLGFGGIRSQASQYELDRQAQEDQWTKLFERSEEWRLEDLARKQEALDFYRGVYERDEERRAPYREMSLSIGRNTVPNVYREFSDESLS